MEKPLCVKKERYTGSLGRKILLYGLVGALLLPGTLYAASHSVTESAKYSGTYGLRVLFDDSSPAYVEDESPVSEKRYRARFYVNVTGLVMPENDQFELFNGYHDINDNGPDAADDIEFRLSIVGSAQGRMLRVEVRKDDDSFSAVTPELLLEDGWHSIEIDWIADSSGKLDIWLDGVAKTGLEGIVNQESAVDYVRLGVIAGNPATMSGEMDIDDFSSKRTEYVGVNVLISGCSGDEVVLDLTKFSFPENIPVLCKATMTFTTIAGQSVMVAAGKNLRIESPSTALLPGFEVKAGGLFSVGK